MSRQNVIVVNSHIYSSFINITEFVFEEMFKKLNKTLVSAFLHTGDLFLSHTTLKAKGNVI